MVPTATPLPPALLYPKLQPSAMEPVKRHLPDPRHEQLETSDVAVEPALVRLSSTNFAAACSNLTV